MTESRGGTVQALREAAERAQRAPSILNTQPWRWRIRGEVLSLYADRSRQVASVDPDGRLLTLSCGAVLHHARVALTASGHDTEVDRSPDPTDPDRLASLFVVATHESSTRDVQILRDIRHRRTDRRPFAAIAAVPEPTITSLRRAGEEQHASLYRVRSGQLPFLAAAAEKAARAEDRMRDYQADLARWTHGRSKGEGVPAETVAAQVPREVPLRDFAPERETLLDPGWGDDRFADFLIITTPGDGPADWLVAGEATSAVWLRATRERLVVSAMSDVVEVAQARAMLRTLLDSAQHPQLVLRVGLDMQSTPTPESPRRRPEITYDDA
jgi:hypothetical protein